jgi:hypothetical protein
MGDKRITDIEETSKAKDSLTIPTVPLGQNCPSHCPRPEDELGEPMSIREVARLVGCSVWTIRQRYLPAGLPHFRLSARGKLVFYRNQVVRWMLERQRQKGGMRWPFGSAAGSIGRMSG